MPGSHSPSPEASRAHSLAPSSSSASSTSPSPRTPRTHRADPFNLADSLSGSMLHSHPHAHSSSPTAAGTPPAPAGLVISKAGIEASTRGDKLTGILCLKITLPKDSDGYPQRWSLFSGPRPKLRSIPALYPLPASLALSSTSSHIAKAAALLQLPPAGAYPPPPAEGASGQLRPYIDVSKATDQVYVVLDASPPAGQAKRRSSIGSRARSEWLVVIEFETDVEEDSTGGETWYKASIPTPKCLENFIRLEIAPKDEASAQSAEIVTTPRVHPLPASVFDAHDPIQTTPTKRRKSFEDGWEDGEVPGTESSDGTFEDDSSWLHGRFQSTDVMALQWGFAPALGTPPDLRVAPRWDGGEPSITLTFEAVIASIPGPFGLEAVLPPGWGWSDLQIRADGLFSWRSADLNGLGALVSATATQPDDTLSTIDALSPTLGSPAAMPKLAALDAADFSFELNSFHDEKPTVPTTPSLRRIERHGGAALKVVPRVPTPAAVFELEFEQGDDDDEERVVLVNGTLVPLPMTLVSPDAPVSIPFFRFDDASLPAECDVQCPHATLARPGHSDAEDEEGRLCDTTVDSVGTFVWADDTGEPLPPLPVASVSGTVKVVVQRNIWGLQTVSIMVPWPAKAEEVTVGFSTPAAAVRVVRASARGSPLPHAVIAREEEGRALADVRIGGGRGNVEIVLEIAEDNGVALPVFAGASGELRVELAGDGWDKLLAVQPVSNMTPAADYASYTGDLSELPFIMFAPPPAPEPVQEAPRKMSRTRRLVSRLVSWNVLVNLVLLWILGSLAGQVARLRAEVAFVADETRDLRLYGFERPKLRDYERERAWEDERAWERAADSATVTVTVLPGTDTTQLPGVRKGSGGGGSHDSGAAGPDGDTSLSHHDPAEYGLGRVVFDGGRWGALFNHPSVRAVTDTVSRLWHTLLWLIAA